MTSPLPIHRREACGRGRPDERPGGDRSARRGSADTPASMNGPVFATQGTGTHVDVAVGGAPAGTPALAFLRGQTQRALEASIARHPAGSRR